MIRRFALLLPLLICLLASTAGAGAPQTPTQPPAAPDESQVTVYLTDIGLKYHTIGCKLLKSKIPVTLAEAKKSGYTPCKVCKAPR